MQDRELFIDEMITFLTEETYSPYRIAKILNQFLRENGKKEIVPQMMYNYARSGMLVPKVKLHGPDLRPISRVETAHFLVRYMIKNNVEFRTNSTDVPSDQLQLF